MATSRSGSLISGASVRALLLGLIVLGLLVAFALGLQRASANESGVALAPLPDTLPGGWTALEQSGGPDGADAAEYNQQQQAAIDYVNQVYRGVYDEGTEFRAYLSPDQQALITATVFAASGGAFGPANGVADPAQLGLDRAPVEVTRNGDAVCVSSYQSSDQASGASADQPVSISCQQPGDGVTVQIGSQGLSIDDTVKLLGELTASLA